MNEGGKTGVERLLDKALYSVAVLPLMFGINYQVTYLFSRGLIERIETGCGEMPATYVARSFLKNEYHATEKLFFYGSIVACRDFLEEKGKY